MKRIIAILYVMICVLSLYSQNNKLSPFVCRAMMSQKAASATAASTASGQAKAKGAFGVPSAAVPAIMAFVRTTDTEALRQQGCRIYAQWESLSPESDGNIVIASIPLNKLGALASMPQIKRIEAGRSCSVTNDTTATITKAREVWQMQGTSNPSPLTGKGVVVGVMDIGFDLTHPTFYSSDGATYRIKQLWDQLDWTKGGEAVTGKTDAGNDTIYVGRQYVGQEALLALQHSTDGLTQIHGTHTTGTAAGSGWQGQTPSALTTNPSPLYSGMAPDADICLVCNMAGDNADLIPDSLQYLYTSATDMLGFKYIFDYADKVGKPCVISFSEGSHDDLWESGLYGEVLSKMLGPGHILCASAGNEASGDGTYMHKAAGEASKGAFIAKWAENYAGYVMSSTKPVNVTLSFYQNNTKVKDWTYDATELAQYPDSSFVDTVLVNNDSIAVYIQTYPSCFDETKYATDLFVTDLKNERYGYATPTILTVNGEENDIELCSQGGYFIKNDIDPSLTDYDMTHNVLFPGVVKDVVCVGATSYVTSWKNIYGNSVGTNFGTDGVRARYSSVGPTLSGLTKPDVMAPGSNVVSSCSSFKSDAGSTMRRTDYNDRTYPWAMMSGTSMATPVASGIVALWLQMCPTLTPDMVKDVIAHTATRYDSSLEYPNSYYGWGQIDAIAGVEYIQKHYTGIEDVSSSMSQVSGADAIYTLDGRRVKSLDGQHGVFIVSGKKVIR